ncbi:hypothetical protein GJ496_010004 [Pomphorhynchus laevis]|nr:hypothetical protein GJ496_010004 [Pomphorhynchus laevis]
MYQGMYNPISKQILLLINSQLTLPWILYHTCKNDKGEQSCDACELQLSWFNLSRLLLTHISPRDDVKLADSEIPSTTELKILSNCSSKELKETPDADVDQKRDLFNQIVENKPENGVWITAAGIYHFRLNSLLPHLQLFYNMLKEISKVWHVDALHQLLSILQMLVLKDEVLTTALKTNVGFLTYCIEKMIVPLLWRILSLGYCQLNKICLTILLHTVIHDQGKLSLWGVIEQDFDSSDWEIRANAGM